MNGLDLYNFVYDTFVRPQHPFASRDVRHREGLSVSQEAAGEPSPCRDDKRGAGATSSERERPRSSAPAVGRRGLKSSGTGAPVTSRVSVLADHRKDKT